MQSKPPRPPSLIKALVSKKDNSEIDPESLSETEDSENETTEQEDLFSPYLRAQWFEQRAGDGAGPAELFKHLSSVQQAKTLPESPRGVLADQADRWEFVGPTVNENPFIGIGRVTQIDVHPDNGNIVVAAAAGGGVWRTDNGGRKWRPLMRDEPTLTMGAVAFAPSNPDYIYAASGEDAGPLKIALQGSGIYRSSDGGESWKLVGKVTSTLFSAIVVHPKEHLTVYAAGNRGLHKSTDGGETWISNPGLLSLFDGWVTDVVLAHDDHERIYIGVYKTGVLRSTRGGAGAFELLNIDNALQASLIGWPKLAIGRGGPYGSNFLAVRLGLRGDKIYTTLNGGSVWTNTHISEGGSNFSEWDGVIAVHPQDDNFLFVGAGSLIQRFSIRKPGDKVSIGRPLSSSPDDLRLHEDQQDIAFDLKAPNLFYVANDGGVYRSPSSDNGPWQFASGELSITQVYDLDISEKAPDLILCGTQDNNLFYRSDCPTNTWEQPSMTIPADVVQVAIDPADPKIFYFVLNEAIREGSEACLLNHSTDGGRTVARLDPTGITGGGSPFVTIMKINPDAMLANPKDNRQMFICGFYHLFYSTDGGKSFHRVEHDDHKRRTARVRPSPNPFVPEGEISALEYSVKNSCVLYLGTRTGRIYKTANGGRRTADWNKFENRLGSAPVGAIGIDPNNPDKVWVGLSGNGVLRTSRVDAGYPEVSNPYGVSHLFKLAQDGSTWKDASGKDVSSCLPDTPIGSIVIDNQNSDIAYVASDVGVFRTSDGGYSWHSFQIGLPRSAVTKLKLNRTTRRLVAGTMGRGIYWRQLPDEAEIR